MYGGEEPGSSPPASHLSAPRAYMPPDSSMSEGTYSTQPGALPAKGTVPSVLPHVKEIKMFHRRADTFPFAAECLADRYVVFVFVSLQAERFSQVSWSAKPVCLKMFHSILHVVPLCVLSLGPSEK